MFLLLTAQLSLTACSPTDPLPPDTTLPNSVTRSGDTQNGLFQGDGTYIYLKERAASPEELPQLSVPRTEQILTEDHQRLNDQINNLRPERPGIVDAYFLTVGGDGTESVFMRDIEVARTGLQNQFDLQGRAIRLLNHRDYESLPLATRPSISASLQALDEQLNPEEDLLVIHLVSHGGRDGELLLQQPGIELPNLSPTNFAEMLSPLSARRKLVVVSACFSGQWIDQLKNDDSWIMTSARRDRTSFGCGDDSEMTWFTKAVYQEVGLLLDAPDSMFEQIEEQIRTWEEDIGMEEEELSYPQMFIGEGMRQWLSQHQWQSEE